MDCGHEPLSLAGATGKRHVQMLYARSDKRLGHFSLLVNVLLLRIDKDLHGLTAVGLHAAPCNARVILVCCSGL